MDDVVVYNRQQESRAAPNTGERKESTIEGYRLDEQALLILKSNTNPLSMQVRFNSHIKVLSITLLSADILS